MTDVVIYGGADPGWSSGALCLIYDFGGKEEVEIYRLDKMAENEIADLFYDLSKMKNIKVMLERVWGRPGQHPSSTFKFGDSYGGLRWMMKMGKIPFDTPTPQKWMKFYGMKRDDNETDVAWKGRLWAKAKELYPNVKIVKSAADAVLLADYCKHKFK